LHLGRTGVVIASHRASKDARPLGQAMAKQSKGAGRCLDRRVGSLLAMTIPPERHAL
jgi:hypothetical protein